MDDLPDGYDIQHWSNPDQWLVYKEEERCKCCGRGGDYMKRIGPQAGFTTRELAKAWLDERLAK